MLNAAQQNNLARSNLMRKSKVSCLLYVIFNHNIFCRKKKTNKIPNHV